MATKQAVRVTATPEALALIERLRASHGELMFHQSGGCCDGSSPMCFERGEVLVGPSDVLLGEVGGCPFYMSASQFEHWQHTHLTIDAAHEAVPQFGLHASTRRNGVPNMSLAVYGIPNCNTVKKARTWLDEQGVGFVFHDHKKQGVPAHRLDDWIAQVGWEVLVNRQGTTWRQLDEAVKAGVVDAASAKALMLANPSVIKRPVIEQGSRVLAVGFDEKKAAAVLAAL